MNITSPNKGVAAELEVSAKLIKDGWYVFRCINYNSPCDLIIERGGICQRVDVTCSSTQFTTKIRTRLGSHCDVVLLWDGKKMHSHPNLTQRPSRQINGLPLLPLDIVLSPMPSGWNTYRINSRGTPMVDMKLVGKRYKRATGTNDLTTAWRIRCLLRAINSIGHKKLSTDLHEKRITPLELYDLYRDLWNPIESD